ncbi:MAG: S8 family serine peptidase, partial [Myxococcota bacterium]
MIRLSILFAGILAIVGCAEGAGGSPEASPAPTVELEHRIIVKLESTAPTGGAEEGTLQADAPVLSKELERVLATAGADLSPLLPGVNEAFERAHQMTPTFDFSTVMATEVLDHDTLQELAEALRKLPEVEFAYLQPLAVPPPADIAPPSTNFTSQQGYRNTGTNGVGATYASGIGLTGQGVRISDCEYGWNLAHEDLVDQGVVPEPNQTSPSWVFSNGWDSHGTAVLGELGATANTYGVTGIAPGAGLAVYPEWSNQDGARRSASIAAAIADSAAGDIVVLEMQTVGANGGYGPAEYDPVVWNVVQAGTSAGVIVVAAAGNGNEDLDSAGYAAYRARGDSGAIIVGAGQSASRTKMSF